MTRGLWGASLTLAALLVMSFFVFFRNDPSPRSNTLQHIPREARFQVSGVDELQIVGPSVRLGSAGRPRYATLAFPDGEEVTVQLRVPPAPADIPGPSLMEKYARYLRAVEAGDADAAFALYDSLMRCRAAYTEEKDLLRAVELLHQTHQLKTAADELPSKLSDSSLEDLAGIEASFLRRPFEYCRGITETQKGDAEKWLKLAADAGHFWALSVAADRARQAGDAEETLRKMKATWQIGNAQALPWLAELNRGWGNNPKPPDPVEAYASSLLYLQIMRAMYGGQPTRLQRKELDSLSAQLNERARGLRQHEIDAALRRAKAILRNNPNCCYTM